MGRGKPQLPGQRIVERWRPLEPDEIKINFDGAFDKQIFKYGIGIVCRDSEGKILYCRLEVNNRIPTTFAAKALACVQAVRMGLDLSYQRVVVEGDALSIIKKIQRNENDKSMLSPYIIDIKTLSKNFNKCRFRRIGRKGNETAHAIAQEALKLNITTYMEGQSLRTVITPAVKDAKDLELS
ncbi:uncharacterized protein LOC108477907 [Gossypium arboreum]|uniref:RNase H type-1 domain-containing protein n=1 Tax=Gossypium arboreum TaxID=29729 RepID=A0ABR0PB68_GOSAR|nr:uncharacterized protein LOC108477907 [Gossypium arboreum]KAK5818410.1 hypothetical protein PVK06_023347 [Gossypium arboreum]